jgi:hypothetical protein
MPTSRAHRRNRLRAGFGHAAKVAFLALAPLLVGCFSSAGGLGAASLSVHDGGPAGGSDRPTSPLGRFEVASLGAPHATIAPTSCLSGEHDVFLGADLFDPETHLVVRLAIDPLHGPALRVYDADEPFDRTVLFFRDECPIFDMTLERTGYMVNDIVIRSLDLEVECENEDGATIRGSATASRCD